jgi:anti-anti-sigma factor
MTCRIAGDIAILDLAGRFVVSPGETEIVPLRSVVRKLIADQRILLALNLRSLAAIDARGLGELVSTLTTLRRCGGELILIAPTAVVTKMLAVTRLDRVFPSCDSELEAVRRLRRSVPARENRSRANDCGAGRGSG